MDNPQVTFHGVTLSDAVEAHIRRHAAKLRKLDARLTSLRVVVEQPHRHSQHGRVFRILIDMLVPGAELLVRRAPAGDHAYQDVYAAIDAAFTDANRRLRDFVRRQRRRRPHSRASAS